jgi:hypothetical protein
MTEESVTIATERAEAASPAAVLYCLPQLLPTGHLARHPVAKEWPAHIAVTAEQQQ